MAKQLLPHVVAQGEHLEKLAFTRGFDADAVWRDPKNDAIRKLRKDPLVLTPGDVLYIPEPDRPSLPIAMGKTNKYKAEVPRIDVHLVLHDDGGAPMAGETFEIEGLVGEAGKQRTTGADGSVSFEAPVHLREVTLFFPKRHLRFGVKVGDLDPIEERSGVVGRLQNLGFLPSAEAPADEAIAAALRAFQKSKSLPETGALDADTRSALTAAHGG